MTDREKLNERLHQAMRRGSIAGDSDIAMGSALIAEVESLIRDAAERAWRVSREQVVDYVVSTDGRQLTDGLPADFPLVADSPLTPRGDALESRP